MVNSKVSNISNTYIYIYQMYISYINNIYIYKPDVHSISKSKLVAGRCDVCFAVERSPMMSR